MRVFLAVLVLIFSLQSWTNADDVRDFEIEGMSIGDSLLDHFSKDEIDNFVKYGIKLTYNEEVNQLFWPEQMATDELIPPIITEVEIGLEDILNSIRE